MAISFPSSPTTGDLYTYNSKTWQWNGEGWVTFPTQNDGAIAYAAADVDVNRSLLCRQYNLVDSNGYNYGLGTIGTITNSGGSYTNAWVGARWRMQVGTHASGSYTSKFDWWSSDHGFTAFSPFKAMAFQVISAFDTPANGGVSCIRQEVQMGDVARTFNWGSPTPSDMRVGFWFKPHVTGTYSWSLRDTVNFQSFIQEFSGTAGVWAWHEFVVPGRSTGTYASSNLFEMRINFWRHTSFEESSANCNQWNTYGSSGGTLFQTTANVNATATTGTSYIGCYTIVPAEIEFPSEANMGLMLTLPDEEEYQNARFYQIIYVHHRFRSTAASQNQRISVVVQPMWAAPTLSLSGGTSNNAFGDSVVVSGTNSVAHNLVASAANTDTYYLTRGIILDARE